MIIPERPTVIGSRIFTLGEFSFDVFLVMENSKNG